MGHFLVVAMAALAGGSPATTAVFDDPKTGFRLDLGVTDSEICFLKPYALRVNNAVCAQLNVAAAEGKVPPSTTLSAFVRVESWNYMLNVLWQPKTTPGPMSRSGGREFLEGVASNPKMSLVKADPDYLVINDLQVLRYSTHLKGGVTFNSMINYAFIGKDTLVQVSFVTSPEHVQAVSALAEKMMASATMPVGQSPATWAEADTKKLTPFEQGRRVGHVIGAVLMAAFACALPLGLIGLLVYLQVRKRSAPKGDAGRTAP